MTKQVHTTQPLVLGYVPEADANRPEGRAWRYDVERIALRLLVDGGAPLLAAAAGDLEPSHFDGDSRLICEALIRMHHAGADITGEALRSEVGGSVSSAALDDVLAPHKSVETRRPGPIWMERQNLMSFLRDLRRDETLPDLGAIGPSASGCTTTPEARTILAASSVPSTLELIEDFRAMQEGAEAILLSKLMEDDREIYLVLDVLKDVKIPVEMHRSHLEILGAITAVRELGRAVTVTACIDWLRQAGRLERAGGRAKIMTLAGFPDNIATPVLDLARRVAMFSRARFNTGQEVWPLALYRWYDAADRLLYVGITENLTTRTSSHSRKSSWSAFATRRTVVRYPDRKSAETMERWAIRDGRPLFNHVHNDTPEARARLVAYLIEHGRMDLLAPAVSRG